MSDTDNERNLPESSGKPALMVGLGILISRFSGLIRELVLAAFLGTRVAADAFKVCRGSGWIHFNAIACNSPLLPKRFLKSLGVPL